MGGRPVLGRVGAEALDWDGSEFLTRVTARWRQQPSLIFTHGAKGGPADLKPGVTAGQQSELSSP